MSHHLDPHPEHDYHAARQQMVLRQLLDRGVSDPRVLAAMDRVPRERFVPMEEVPAAYGDHAMPIACGQTISQPYMVGLMSESLALAGPERVLEIGTGSGYQTAVLAELCREVYTIERHAPLLAAARERLEQLGYRNIHFHTGDGTLGWPDATAAPFDRILVTAGAAHCPPALWSQLAEGGLLVIPVGPDSEQVLKRMRKVGEHAEIESLVGCRFVPLIGAE